MKHIVRVFIDSHKIARNYGIVANPPDVDGELRKIAARRNQGEARKVSYKRPSPRLSRMELELVKFEARIKAIGTTQKNKILFWCSGGQFGFVLLTLMIINGIYC